MYQSPRDFGEVLIGKDAARPLIEASSSGNDTALQNLLLQPKWVDTMLEKSHSIYYVSRPSEGPEDARDVMAMPMSNLERALTAAARNGQVAAVSTLLAFATQQRIAPSDIITRWTINKTIKGRHGAVFKALAPADPNVINFPLGHGTRPLYEAVRLRKYDVAVALLELEADPFNPVDPQKRISTYNSSMLSRAAIDEGPRMTRLLLEHGLPIPHSAAIHSAARFGHLDTMHLLMEHGADLNSNWSSWTPMHFAASRGKVDAMKLLEQSGARSDLKDDDGRTPAQLLEVFKAAEH